MSPYLHHYGRPPRDIMEMKLSQSHSGQRTMRWRGGKGWGRGWGVDEDGFGSWQVVMHAQSSGTLLAVDLQAAICETHTFQILYLDPKWSIEMQRSHILRKSCMCTGTPIPILLSSQVQKINTNSRRPKALGHQVWFLEVKCYDKWKVNSAYSLFKVHNAWVHIVDHEHQ